MQSVQCKNMKAIDKSLRKIGDLCDNDRTDVIFTALGSEIWDEVSFVRLWNNVFKTEMDVNAKDQNAHGNSILHMAVKRGWLHFVEMLLEREVFTIRGAEGPNGCCNSDVISL